MPLNRLQIILIGSILFTFAAWGGFLMGGSLSFFLTITLLCEFAALVVTFIWKRPGQVAAPQVQHVAPRPQPIRVARVAQAAPQRAVPARPAALPAAPRESLWAKMTAWWNRTMNQLAPHAQQGGQAIVNQVNQSPSLWIGALLLVTAGLELLFASGNWKLSHVAMATAVGGIACILHHYNQLNYCLQKLWEHWKVTWLVGSIVTILLWFVHDWEWPILAAAIVSTIGAIISLGNWWGDVRSGAGELAGIGWRKFIAFCVGDYGIVKILIGMTAITFVIIAFFYLGGEFLFDDEVAQARAWSLTYTILMLLGFGALIYKVHKKMQVPRGNQNNPQNQNNP